MSSYKSHHKGSSSKTPKSSKTSGSGSSGARVGQQNTSFLFVVNEVQLNSAYRPVADIWGNLTPPLTKRQYGAEIPGQVFRYHNGVVTPAHGYVWNRTSIGTQGCIGYNDQYLDDTGNLYWDFVSLEEYRTSTVFDCGPFLPWVYVDVDVTTIENLDANDAPYNRFWAVHFSHSDHVSQATHTGYKYAAGRHAKWIPSLVHENYKNLKNAPDSRGLGGELGLVLGLMALTEPQGRTNDAFYSHWNNNEWTGQRATRVSQDGPPRGVIVHVALDPDQPGQTADEIWKFEWFGVAVFG
ncbi:hypothetical protein F4779DRAFT_515789 [Xylariaceae sp. FL0662B]|nr:hypothetical protein F4779DRAFT_515789 [Xylariaceae sp. FL0662B]